MKQTGSFDDWIAGRALHFEAAPMPPLEALVTSMTRDALVRLDAAIERGARRDLRMIHAMTVARRRGLAQLFRYAAARVRAIQQGARP